jgi:isoamylase
MRVWPGYAYPLGATWDGGGVNFALFSEHATKVELCLFDSPEAVAESHRITLPETTDHVWHGYSAGGRAGADLRLSGARSRTIRRGAIVSIRTRSCSILTRRRSDVICTGTRRSTVIRSRGGNDLAFDEQDSAPHAPLARVTETAFDWGDDRPPRIAWHDTVVYEVHVKGFTRLHPDVPENLRGTYAGLASPASIDSSAAAWHHGARADAGPLSPR